jgi:hypothetical protein
MFVFAAEPPYAKAVRSALDAKKHSEGMARSFLKERKSEVGRDGGQGFMEERKKPIIKPGFRIGKLTVAAPTDLRKNGYTIWNCDCDCGGSIRLDTRTLQRGTVRDCGCETKVKPDRRT